MIRDLLSERPDPASYRDVCVVGAGAAGIALAVELARLGRSVTLLEAGGRTVEEASQAAYEGHLGSLPHRGLHAGRVRALGGTTNLWGGQVLELDDVDFERRPWVSGSGWPLPKHELRRHYARALQVEGLDTAILQDDEVWHALGMQCPKTESLITYLSRWCPEPNFARLHRDALGTDAIEVWLHASACELLIDNGDAKGVRCRTLTGIDHIFHCRDYVFCLGAIECSRFFLQPRGGALPWNESGLLGRHFQDHLDSDAATLQLQKPSEFFKSFDSIFLRGSKYSPKIKLQPGIEEAQQILRAGATFYSHAETEESMPQMKLTAKKLLRGQLSAISVEDFLFLVRKAPSLLRPSYRFAVQHRAYHRASAPMTMRVHCEQEPLSQSSITLANDRDEFGLLRTHLSWHISELELRTIRQFVQTAGRQLEGLARVIPHPNLESEAFRAACEDSYHHMGGMRMSVSPSAGVVSAELKLHGTKNTYVCSSAVFPGSGFSNPTHTLIALAMRLAEHLATA